MTPGGIAREDGWLKRGDPISDGGTSQGIGDGGSDE